MHVVIVPGNGGGDVFHANWYGWAHRKLNTLDGVRCDLENMPDPVYARETVWLPFMKDTLRCDRDTVIVGHSSGACAALRFAEQHEVRGLVLVSAYVSDLGDSTERKSGYFSRPWDWAKVRQNAGFVVQFGSSDDPFLPWSEQREVAQQLQLGDNFISHADRGHFMSSTFPDLIRTIKDRM